MIIYNYFITFEISAKYWMLRKHTLEIYCIWESGKGFFGGKYT